MSEFAPRNDDHAVVEVSFNLELSRPIPAEAIQAALGSDASSLPWAQELPAASGIPGMQILMGPGSQPTVSPAAGAQFAFLRPNGVPTWVLRLTGQMIAVECNAYTRWAEIGSTAERLLLQALGYFQQQNIDISIQVLNFQVIDEFVCNSETPDFSSLLKNRELVGNTPFRGGNLWHCFLGWFEDLAGRRVLQNLNVQSTGRPDPTDPQYRQLAPYSVKVTHFQQVRASLGENVPEVQLDKIVNALHEYNKSVILDLITSAMAQRISLKASNHVAS